MKVPKPLGVPLNKLHVMGIYTEENQNFNKEDLTPVELLRYHLKNITTKFNDMKKTLQEYEAEIYTLQAEISNLKAADRT